MQATLTLPSIHLNGTGRRMLAEGYGEAYRKLQATIEAFRQIEFNARDYYVQPEGAWATARAQRDAQLEHLCAVRDYLEAHLLHLGE